MTSPNLNSAEQIAMELLGVQAEFVPSRYVALIDAGLQAALKEQETALRKWREWAQFVYLGGGPLQDIPDLEMRERVCAAHDAMMEPIANAAIGRIQAAEAHAAALADRLTRYELKLREIYWVSHGCHFPALYGDDGEMQCQHQIDFKRMPFDELEQRVMQIKRDKLQRDIELAALPQDGEARP